MIFLNVTLEEGSFMSRLHIDTRKDKLLLVCGTLCCLILGAAKIRRASMHLSHVSLYVRIFSKPGILSWQKCQALMLYELDKMFYQSILLKMIFCSLTYIMGIKHGNKSLIFVNIYFLFTLGIPSVSSLAVNYFTLFFYLVHSMEWCTY